ncbi:hypothetical protein E3N88_38771 [Mikania micrantha]|uniref:Uncharacterized protein n=1 Tax=Mikania micrantha TaxID=192012 RepID=A0A5N6LUX5_9ASTR|nr:hypothetical protein E3N88_38771 [Mikania micrantha]
MKVQGTVLLVPLNLAYMDIGGLAQEVTNTCEVSFCFLWLIYALASCRLCRLPFLFISPMELDAQGYVVDTILNATNNDWIDALVSHKEHHHPVTILKTDNFDKVTVEIAKEHMGLLSTLIDPDDMERIDIV